MLTYQSVLNLFRRIDEGVKALFEQHPRHALPRLPNELRNAAGVLRTMSDELFTMANQVDYQGGLKDVPDESPQQPAPEPEQQPPSGRAAPEPEDAPPVRPAS
jgi:hypothetical protein